MGYQDEIYLTPEQNAQVNDKVMQIMQTANSSQSQLQTFLSSKPDFAKVVGANDPVTGLFTYAPPLQRALMSNPSIQGAINGLDPAKAAVLAYEIASKDPQYMKEVAEANKPVEQKQSEEAQQVIQQANSQVSISAVAGQGQLDKAASIRAMSDEQFDQYKQGIIAQA